MTAPPPFIPATAEGHRTPSFLSRPDGAKIAYHGTSGADPQAPGLLFLSGYGSDMEGTKALFLKEQARARGWAFVRFDYQNHGASHGGQAAAVLSTWLDNATAVLKQVCHGRQILIGSSMGGWLALLLARLFPTRLVAIVGIAAAPDFTRALERNHKADRSGAILSDGLTFSAEFLADARRHLLGTVPLALPCPLHLMQGLEDTSVPWKTALNLIDQVIDGEASVLLIKDGDHRLSRPQDLTCLIQILERLMASDAEKRAAIPVLHPK